VRLFLCRKASSPLDMFDQLVGWLQVVFGALSWTFPDPLRRASSGGRCKRRTVTVTRTRLGLFERTRLKITTNDSEP
jgi:hypothetical protein